ncbi:NADPH:quinone oxidoreductase family protein [Pacificimonas flava]|uniref:Putative Zn-dependent oxidoreductase n=1 Tax=Pacificimonas flava TaxID=1234595 RepID=M2TC80_9SPHN|nr:NADPH:quinone oxidoreductase family protein [Pacificimonas flava]EMD84244.1 Putative Zn-dependent oxidoreductase [Pacificimonas flava]MBB5279879.1 NADPH2:quinone reductase [Pacificimonas flava]
MKALLCKEHGPPENLVVEEVATPEPGKGQVRINLKAAGVNFPDTLIIRDLYQFKPELPFSPGGEASGVVDAVGEGVTHLKQGDRVLVMCGNGAFAEQIAIDASRVIPIPDEMDFDIAAGFTMTYGTSHHALKQRANLQAGETLLVLGAAGGVGLAAVEIGKLMGAKVVAAASTQEKLDLCREYGADETINYTEEDLREGIKRATGGAGPDVIYDPVGDKFAEPAFRSIAWNGRYLVVGFAGGEIPKLPLNLTLIKGAAIVGVFWGRFTATEPKVHQANMAELLGWLKDGKLKPHVSKRFPLEQGGEAIRWMMDRKAMGKVLIEI